MNSSLSEADDMLRKWESSLSIVDAIFRLPFGSGRVRGRVLIEPSKVTVGSDDACIRFNPSDAVCVRYGDIREWPDPPEGSPVCTLSFDFTLDRSSLITIYELPTSSTHL
jgi:hypothetical protein